MLAATFWENKNPLRAFRALVVFVLMVSVLMVDGVCPPAGVLVVSHLCFGGRWHLGGTLAVCPQVLTVFSDVLRFAHVFCGVLPVFQLCFGGIEETVFFLE